MSEGKVVKQRQGKNRGMSCTCENYLGEVFHASMARSSHRALEMVYLRIREGSPKAGDKKRCIGIRG